MIVKNAIHTRSFAWSVTMSVILIVLYLLTREFFAADSGALLVLVDLIALLTFAVVVIRSMIFWYANQNTFKNPHLPLLVNVITVFTLLYLLPSLSTGKMYHKRLVRHLNLNEYTCGCRLYTDHYKVSDGFFTGDVTATYLTDRNTFRKYLGNADEECESFKINCHSDSVTVLKINDATADTVRQVFNLTKLKADGDFD